MRYDRRSRLGRFTGSLSILAVLPIAMAMQEARPVVDQDAGVRIQAARSLFGSRLPSLLPRVEPCVADPVAFRLPTDGIVLPELREHPWPRPSLPEAADILAAAASPEQIAEPGILKSAHFLASVREPIVPPSLRPEPWPAPPAVRAWLEPTRVAHIEPDPPVLVAVKLPHETLAAAPLAPVPWPSPEEPAGDLTAGQCPVT